jgi:hypothetical protein
LLHVPTPPLLVVDTSAENPGPHVRTA